LEHGTASPQRHGKSPQKGEWLGEKARKTEREKKSGWGAALGVAEAVSGGSKTKKDDLFDNGGWS